MFETPQNHGRLRAAPRTLACAGLMLAVLALLPGPAHGFHRQGVGACEGCHIMHASEDGQIVWNGGEPLLLEATPTDLCLTCHGGAFGVMDSNPLNPPPEVGGGNFVFQLEDNVNDAPDGLTNPIGGHASGHSILSAAYGLGPDPDWIYSPGGSFPSDQLGCLSCHDPHGNQNFRMLNGAGPVQNGAYTFFYDAPQAEGLPVMDPLSAESPSYHTAYRSGMSRWCANCHDQYLSEGGHVDFEHPTDSTIDSQEINQYNRYLGFANPGGGSYATSYIPEVAFEDPANTTTSTTGPTAGSRLMCLTCHRAHGSSAPHGGRWDFRVNDILDDGLISGSYPLPSPYPGPTESQLCRKCHNQNHGRGEACIACHAR